MTTMIFLASDHAGFEHKEALKEEFSNLGIEYTDLGPETLNPKDDYPDLIVPAAKAVASTEGAKAIVFGGSGQGEAIAANRIAGVRAAVLHTFDEKIIQLSREHNDANVLSIGARFMSIEEVKKAARIWIDTDFTEDERHVRRLQKIESLTADSN